MIYDINNKSSLFFPVWEQFPYFYNFIFKLNADKR